MWSGLKRGETTLHNRFRTMFHSLHMLMIKLSIELKMSWLVCFLEYCVGSISTQFDIFFNETDGNVGLFYYKGMILGVCNGDQKLCGHCNSVAFIQHQAACM